MLYEMREEVVASERGGPYRACHRVDAPESGYGCDPSVHCACFDSEVRGGRWVRAMNCPPLPGAGQAVAIAERRAVEADRIKAAGWLRKHTFDPLFGIPRFVEGILRGDHAQETT